MMIKHGLDKECLLQMLGECSKSELIEYFKRFNKSELLEILENDLGYDLSDENLLSDD